MILAIFSELLARGGIQRVGQHVCAVLQEVADDGDEPCYLFSLNDPKGLHPVEVAGRAFIVRGFGMNRIALARAVLSKSLKCRLLYVGHPHLAPLGLLCKLLNPRLRYVVSAYGIEVWTPLSPLRRLGLRSATALTAISDFTARKMVETQGVDAARIQVVPCVITSELLHANGNGRKSHSSHNSKKTLLAVGRLDSRERHKGFDEVILALQRLAQSDADVVFVVAGDGDDKNRLQELASKRGLSDRVIFKGTVSDPELIDLYKSCDVFLMPSSQEGFGIVFLEAMAFNKPVIGGNHGGTPEVILDNETGFLVEHGDVAALADKIGILLRDPELCKRMGEAGRRRVEENFTFESLRETLRGLLTRLQD
jgi:phosphatidylinositol alpha-1,6-mannosyltransferase